MIKKSIHRQLHTNHGLANFRLHAQTICNGHQNGIVTTLQDVCTANSECTAAGTGQCQTTVAYVQVHLVETDSDASSVDAQSAGFVLLSVKFDMASLSWSMEMQFDDYEEGTRRVLLLSKTRQLNGVVIYTDRNDLPCGARTTDGQSITSRSAIDACLVGISHRHHVLHSFAAIFDLQHSLTPEQRVKLENGFQGHEDFSTGHFKELTSARADDASYVQLNNAAMAAEGSLMVTKTRVVVITLTYTEVLAVVGKHTRQGAGGSEVNVDFFVGMATLRVRDGKLTTVIETRDILTKIGTNYVLSHDITDDSMDDIVVPSIAVSLYNVNSRTLPMSSWGFISYNIRLPPTAIAAGVTFDQRDVIPVDSVIGSIAFFQDDPVDTNAYPCIFRPSVQSYDQFSAANGCSSAIQSVRLRLHHPIF